MGHKPDNVHNTKMQFLIQPDIRLDSDVRYSVVEILNNDRVQGESQKRIYQNE